MNVEIGVDCQIFVIVIYLTVTEFYNFGQLQGIIGCINSKEMIFYGLYYLIFMSAEKIKTTLFVECKRQQNDFFIFQKKLLNEC